MTLDLPHALEYLHGDQVLLQEVLKLFAGTLAQLQTSLEVARSNTDTNTNHAAWQTFYRALHTAKPVLLILANSDIRTLITQLCEVLATENHLKTLELLPIFDLKLHEMKVEILAQTNTPLTQNLD